MEIFNFTVAHPRLTIYAQLYNHESWSPELKEPVAFLEIGEKQLEKPETVQQIEQRQHEYQAIQPHIRPHFKSPLYDKQVTLTSLGYQQVDYYFPEIIGTNA